MLKILGVSFAIVMLAPAGARADGDPASDVLLTRDLFFTYNPPPSPALQRTLNAQIAAAKAAGLPLKVALIRAPLDLGLIPELFGKPQPYADFLGQEISLQYKGPLLVVMPSGYGVHGVDATTRSAVDALPKPNSGDIDDLAQAASVAIPKLASASGHPIAVPDASIGGAGGSSGTTILVVAVVAGAAVAAAVVIILRRRSRSRGTT